MERPSPGREIMHYICVLAALMLVAGSDIEGPYTQGKLAVYVVCGPQTDSRSYITLDEGLKSGTIKVRERESGEVNTVVVENRSDKFLFLHVGDIIRGGKQDRTIASDVVLKPHSPPVAIDAFCVEHGRWLAHDGALAFEANDAMVSGAALKRSIQADRSQEEVWKGVAETEALAAARVGAPSSRLSATGTYSAIVDEETLRAKRKDYLQNLLPQVAAHKDAIGVVVAIDGKLVGGDVYGSHDLFKKLLRKVLDSYVQESILAGESATAKIPPNDDVKRFLDKGGAAITESISDTMERRASENAEAEIFEYRIRQDGKALHRSYVKKK
jgi:hypothetical protein